jgi:hypothetical protein
MSQNLPGFLYILGAMFIVAALSLSVTGAPFGTEGLPLVLTIAGGFFLITAARLSKP